MLFSWKVSSNPYNMSNPAIFVPHIIEAIELTCYVCLHKSAFSQLICGLIVKIHNSAEG